MDCWLVFLVFTGTLLSVAFAQTRQYYFVNRTLNWTDAQSVCRQNYTDLATLESIADVEAVSGTTSSYNGLAWIGLYDELLNSWKWSLNTSSFYDDGETAFRNWDSNQPNNLDGSQHCVILMSGNTYSGKWDDRQCHEDKLFVCYNGTTGGSPSFVVSTIYLNWTAAQKFCRENYVDLASVRNQDENDAISHLGNGSFLWIGLYREKSWSDGSSSTFQFWSDSQPSHSGEECIAANFMDSGKWHDEDCTLTYPFICYKPIPPNAEGFRASTQDESSITLQWNKVSSNTSFVLQFNGTETNIRAPDRDGPITHTISSLSAGTKYTFTLFSVFDSIRSSGVELTAVTAPANAEGFRASTQDESSITLQWDKVNSNTSFVLQFNGTETNIRAPDGDGPITHIISSLTAGTKYTFTLFSLFENIRSNGVSTAAVTAPENAERFRASKQNENPTTLQWDKVNSNTSFVLQFNGTETNIRAPDRDGPITHTISSLTAGTEYTFTLFSVFENIRSSGVQLSAVTAPENAGGFIKSAQSETSITLQWNKVNSNTSFILQLSDKQLFIRAPEGDGPITHTVSSLTAGTEYLFTLFSVFENVRSAGVQLSAATVPENAEGFRPATQDESSITLQWNKVSSNTSFILQFNGTETNIRAPDGDGPITHTISSLTAKTKYTFTLFSVFENVRSSGVSITAATGPNYIVALNMRLNSYGTLSESEMQALVTQFFIQHGLPPQFSMKVKPIT